MNAEETSDAQTTEAESRLSSSRRQVEDRLEELRLAVRERTGAQLAKRAWALPLVAAGVGFSLAMWLRRRGRRARDGRGAY